MAGWGSDPDQILRVDNHVLVLSLYRTKFNGTTQYICGQVASVWYTKLYAAEISGFFP